MAQIPLNTQFIGLAATVDTTERRSATINAESAAYTMQDIVDTIPSGPAYRVYTALLTQSGTDAPVATVLENTLGGTPVWSRTGVGTYNVTLAGEFPVGKTVCFLTVQNNEGDARILSAIAYAGAPNADKRSFTIQNATTNQNSDGLAANSCIEIRVYP